MQDVQVSGFWQKLYPHEVQMSMQVQVEAFMNRSCTSSSSAGSLMVAENASDGHIKSKDRRDQRPLVSSTVQGSWVEQIWLAMPAATRAKSTARTSAPTQIPVLHHFIISRLVWTNRCFDLWGGESTIDILLKYGA